MNRLEYIASRITPGARIAITAGSRGISHIPLIIKSIASFIKSKDAIPFVVPAMGSHGGATAQGQLEVLASYGITEETVGCEILSRMDPNITGRFPTPYATGGIQAQRVVALSLTPQSHGNACGIDLADFTTQRLYQELDFEQTYPNAITNTVPGLIKIPMVLYNDKEAIQTALKSCNDIDNDHPRIIRIKNSLTLENIEISEALLSEAKQNPNINVTSNLHAFIFDEKNNIV